MDADPIFGAFADVMHLFFAGMSRYEFCWLAEILIPAYTTWDAVNARAKKLNREKGHRIPELFAPRNSSGKPKGSLSMTLSSAEMMHLTVASVAMFEPLLTAEARAEPAWASWVAHVTLVNCCLQHSFPRSEIVRLRGLIADYKEAFSKVPQYADRGKPKGHALDHLPAYLELYGPFRVFWCFPFEAFLQVLKRMFEMTNYKTAVASASTLWAAKHSLNLLNVNRSEWFENDVTASSEFTPITVSDLQGSASVLLCMCAHPAHLSSYSLLSCYRFVSAVTRGPVDLKVNSWVLITQQGTSHACYLSEMVQLVLGAASVIRMRLTACRQAKLSADDAESINVIAGPSVMLHIMKSVPSQSMLVCLEACAFVGLSCEDCGDHYQYRYVW